MKNLKYILNLEFLTKQLIIRLFLLLILIALVLRLLTEITDELIIRLFIYISVLIGLGNWEKKIKKG